MSVYGNVNFVMGWQIPSNSSRDIFTLLTEGGAGQKSIFLLFLCGRQALKNPDLRSNC